MTPLNPLRAGENQELLSGRGERASGLRTLLALLIGLAGALFIWVAVPLNNFVLGNFFIADDYMPLAAVFVVLVLVLGVNPVLRRLAPGLALGRRQLALIFAMVLVACITPSSGLMRLYPYTLAMENVRVSQDYRLAKGFEAMDVPASLFPDPLGYEVETPASSAFVRELPPGQSIPWTAWLGPLFSWGGYIVPWMVMMLGLALIVLPQWRDNERLPFPLLTIQRELIAAPGPGRLPAIFRNSAFWTAAGLVFGLHVLKGLNAYFPGRLPVLPLEFDLGPILANEPFRHIPFIKYCQLFFVYIGIAFFMPSRVGFSLWFLQIAYSLYIMVQLAYFPPFNWNSTADHVNGAFLTVPVIVIWLGRRRWGQVLGKMFRRARSEDDGRDRAAGWIFLLGCLGMGAWLLWAGVLPLWAFVLVILSAMMALTITRVVAETGMPLFTGEASETLLFVRFFPLSWRSAASMYFAGVVAQFNSYANRVCGMTIMVHGLGMDDRAGPRHRLRLGALFILLIVLSLVISGAVHLWGGYHHAATLDGQERPLSTWGSSAMPKHPEWYLNMWQNKQAAGGQDYFAIGHLGFGVGVTVLLMWLCLASPRWPLHPLPLLFVGTSYASALWFNVFLGWAAKLLILRYGGSKIYARARPFFIGLIIGEISAAVFWTAVTALLAALGLPYERVEILPL